MGMDTKQLTERYAEYAAPMHDQHLFYAYEPSSPPHGHDVPTKHQYAGSSHKSNAAMSALTLLAFLFFLHILQQCLKDHMTSMSTPQIMIMTAGKEGEENIAKITHKNKLDKTGVSYNENNFQTEILSLKDNTKSSGNGSQLENQKLDDSSRKTYFKIKNAEHGPPNGAQKYKIVKNHGNRSLIFDHFYEEFDN